MIYNALKVLLAVRIVLNFTYERSIVGIQTCFIQINTVDRWNNYLIAWFRWFPTSSKFSLRRCINNYKTTNSDGKNLQKFFFLLNSESFAKKISEISKTHEKKIHIASYLVKTQHLLRHKTRFQLNLFWFIITMAFNEEVSMRRPSSGDVKMCIKF